MHTPCPTQVTGYTCENYCASFDTCGECGLRDDACVWCSSTDSCIASDNRTLATCDDYVSDVRRPLPTAAHCRRRHHRRCRLFRRTPSRFPFSTNSDPHSDSTPTLTPSLTPLPDRTVGRPRLLLPDMHRSHELLELHLRARLWLVLRLRIMPLRRLGYLLLVMVGDLTTF